MIAVVVHATFSPCHVARLEVAGAAGRERGHRLVGVEIADAQADYRWPSTRKAARHYSRVTVFRHRDYWTLPYARIHRGLCRVLDEVRPDVVSLPGWAFREALAGLGWCLKRGVARVVMSDSRADTARTLPVGWVKHLLVRAFDAGLVGGAPHRRFLTELGLGGTRCFVGCDVVDNEFFARGGAPWKEGRLMGGRPTLLSCLRMIPVKNIPAVLEVLATSAQDWAWVIAGDGAERGRVEEKIRMHDLGDRVRLLGHVDYPDLPRVYAQADVYLQPSLSDTWALAVNEAMASALPVLVSDRCGCSEDLVRDDVNGFTFDPTRPGSLARALDRLLTCRERWPAMGRASREIIGDWGLDLFARNFWAACETAWRARRHGGARAFDEASAR